MKNLHITCDNQTQKHTIASMLNKAGFRNVSKMTNSIFDIQTAVDVYANTSIRTAHDDEYRPKITYKQFMEKYSMLQQKVNEAIATGYTKQTLSLALGHHKQYITRLLQSGIQNERVIQEIDILLGNKIVVDASVLKELDHKNQVLDKRNDKYNMLEAEYNELNNKYDFIKGDALRLSDDNQALASMRITAENKLRKERTISAVIIIIMIFVLIGAWL